MNETAMNVKVLFFGRLADLVNEPESRVATEQGISAGGLYAQMMAENPSLPSRESDASIKVAVNQSLTDWSHLLEAGDEVAFLPPVTGG